MVRAFNYIVFRVFEFFNNKQDDQAMQKSIYFIGLFQLTMLVPLFLFFRLFIEFDPQVFGDDKRVKYYIGIPLGLILLYLNGRIYRKKFNVTGLEKFHQKFHQEKYKIPIWVIFMMPVIFIIICPILYGAISGTLRFPLFEK